MNSGNIHARSGGKRKPESVGTSSYVPRILSFFECGQTLISTITRRMFGLTTLGWCQQNWRNVFQNWFTWNQSDSIDRASASLIPYGGRLVLIGVKTTPFTCGGIRILIRKIGKINPIRTRRLSNLRTALSRKLPGWFYMIRDVRLLNCICVRKSTKWSVCTRVWSLTRVCHIPKKLHEGHLGVIFNPRKEIVITSKLWQTVQPNFTGISHIWSGIWKCIKNVFFQDGGQHGRRNSESNVFQFSC